MKVTKNLNKFIKEYICKLFFLAKTKFDNMASTSLSIRASGLF